MVGETMRTWLQLALAGHLIAGYSGAVVYYVATSGDDSFPGSPGAPFRTLMRGVYAAGPGDTVIVRDGVYGHENAVTRGDDPNAGEASPVTLVNSGNPGAWITVKADHRWSATLDCEMLCDAYINLYNASYIVIQDFVITRGYKEGIHSNDGAHHVILRGNRIEYIANRPASTGLGLSGMYTNPNCHDFIIDGNVFHDIGRTNPSRLDHALYLYGRNYTIINNIFYNIPHGWSIQAADGLSNVLIANNTFAFRDGAGQSGPIPSAYSAFAFRNRVSQGGQIMLWNAQSNLTIRNNIFFQPMSFAITRYQSTLSICAIDHNLAFGAVGIMADSSGCMLDANQIGVNPMFVRALAAPYDFHLQPASPAIGAGTFVPEVLVDFDGIARMSGSAPDIGAYAFVPGGQM